MNILIVLLRTFGDVLLGNSLIDTLRLRYPEAHIAFCCVYSYRELVEFNPNLDEVIVPKCWDDVLFIASQSKWDRVYMAQQTSKIDNMWHHNHDHNQGNLLDYYAEKLELDGYIRKVIFYPDPKVKVQTSVKNTIMIHSTTLVPSKNWDKLNELVIKLKEKKYDVIQVGSKTDIRIPEALDCREEYSISELYLKLKECKYFIGMDSGLSYLATASGTKVICIMGATTPKTSGPWGDNVITILAKTRKECERQRCHGNCRFNDPCIKTIQVEEVLSLIK